MNFLSALSVPAALALLLATPAAQGAQGGGKQIVARGELDLLLGFHAKAHGGAEKLEAIQTFSFDVTAVTFQGEGEDQREVESPRVHMDVQFGTSTRVVRLEEQLDGKPVVKLSDGVDANNSRAWVDGKARDIPELIDQALIDSRAILAYLDLLYRPDASDLASKFNGVRQRDGVDYRAVHLEFHPTRQIGEAFRNYYHPETALVERIDVYDVVTLRKTRSMLIQAYQNLDGVKFPTRFVFLDAKGKRVGLWRIENAKINADLPSGRFTGP